MLLLGSGAGQQPFGVEDARRGRKATSAVYSGWIFVAVLVLDAVVVGMTSPRTVSILRRGYS